MNRLDLYIDNHQRAIDWLKENMHSGRYEVYEGNITIHCNNKEEKKQLRDLLVMRDEEISYHRIQENKKALERAQKLKGTKLTKNEEFLVLQYNNSVHHEIKLDDRGKIIVHKL